MEYVRTKSEAIVTWNDSDSPLLPSFHFGVIPFHVIITISRVWNRSVLCLLIIWSACASVALLTLPPKRSKDSKHTLDPVKDDKLDRIHSGNKTVSNSSRNLNWNMWLGFWSNWAVEWGRFVCDITATPFSAAYKYRALATPRLLLRTGIGYGNRSSRNLLLFDPVADVSPRRHIAPSLWGNHNDSNAGWSELRSGLNKVIFIIIFSC